MIVVIFVVLGIIVGILTCVYTEPEANYKGESPFEMLEKLGNLALYIVVGGASGLVVGLAMYLGIRLIHMHQVAFGSILIGDVVLIIVWTFIWIHLCIQEEIQKKMNATKV